jgi:capsule biosynthesis phosphatase
VINEDKTLVLDVDGTLCPTKAAGESYADLVPDPAMVERLRWYREQGYYVILQTSRNMRTYKGNVGLINANTLPELVEWLRRHDIPHDELHVGKPWAGHEGFYVDDRAVRPAEFLELEPREIAERIARDGVCDR